MNEFVERLIEKLRPTIVDLDDKIRELTVWQKEKKRIEEFLNYLENDISKIKDYSDQELILSNLLRIESNENEYNASCYLLTSGNENVKLLPQYQIAYQYILKIVHFFTKRNEELLIKTDDLTKICEDKKMNKKYFDIFDSVDPFVHDVDEFADFLRKQDLDNDTKRQILIYTIKKNVDKYKKEVKGR